MTERPPRRSRRRALLATSAVLALAAGLTVPTAASAAPDPTIPVVDGRTQPVFDYPGAVRERVFIPVAGVDQDLDGVTDVTAIDIIRPAESEGTLDVPAIIDPSPYYTTVGRGNEAQLLTDTDGNGATDLSPLFLDNYFVPRGYAVIHAQMDGTGFSTGCPAQGGAGDIESMKVVIDWLQGRLPAYDSVTAAVAADQSAIATADWHNGKAGMIGKSYDGTLSNGVAATGVDGLTTIVPIAAISDWYRYSRTNGIRHNTDYPASLSNTVTNPERRDLCKPTRDAMSLVDGDETGDMNPFWDERNYLPNVDKVEASVLAVHGLNDDNVRMSQFDDWWAGLAENEVPRKVWLARMGHIDPFDFRRAEWVDTLHQWFDYWLYDVPNGIMDEPQSTVEFGPSEYVDEASWPAPGAEPVEVSLSGDLALQADPTASTLQFSAPTLPEGSTRISETTVVSGPTTDQAGRLVMLSDPLAADLRVSGTPEIQLDASLNEAQANIGAYLVDYSTDARTTRSSDGDTNLTTRTCWGASTPVDTGCFLEVERVVETADFWRVSRGVLDTSNREGIAEGQATPVVPGQEYSFDYEMEPVDYVFKKGSRIGVVMTTNLPNYTASSITAVATVDVTTSTISLPVVGGLDAAAASGGLGAPAPVELSFDLAGEGEPIAPQSVEYGSAPAVPAEPTDNELFFDGWFADAAYTTVFDFTAPLTADTVAYAKWVTLAQRVASIELTVSETTVDQGDTVTVAVTGFDAEGEELGDVTDLAALSSSVDTDVFAGSAVTFVHASPHVITAAVNGATDSVTVEVVPAPTPTPTATPSTPPVVGDVTDSSPDDLAATGMSPVVFSLAGAAALALIAGIALFAIRRRREENATS
ncbi:CocE/NonD family hydrolase [Microbacterium sp. P06]|uniref:CocE/NonD family hydrolase n=1 Tax=Microbacterium sp. P06 TaxID=3366949 RepID=UPI003745F482